MANYTSHSNKDVKKMLNYLGLESLDDLYQEIDQNLIYKKDLILGKDFSEIEVINYFKNLASKNHVYKQIYRGAGSYNHYIPQVVSYISKKEEFLTAYTPYQAEISQGLLQIIFEFQSCICDLTGLDVSNASHYDIATSLAEAIMMTVEKKKQKVLVASNINPEYLEVIKTYTHVKGIQVELIEVKNGLICHDSLIEKITEDVSSVVIQSPNYYGLLEDTLALGNVIKKSGTNYIMATNPIALSMIKSPAEVNADIAVLDGQVLGLSMAFGGPYLGIIAAKKEFLRKMPGRIVGMTLDKDGNEAFTLTFQAREQHIRREKALSNICSNQALCALVASAYLAYMGPNGLKEVASHSISYARYLALELTKLPGFKIYYNHEFFNEFVIKTTHSPKFINEVLKKHQILGPLVLDEEKGLMLFCLTELNEKIAIDEMIKIISLEVQS